MDDSDTDIVVLTQMMPCTKCATSTEHASRVVDTQISNIKQWYCLDCGIINVSYEVPKVYTPVIIM